MKRLQTILDVWYLLYFMFEIIKSYGSKTLLYILPGLEFSSIPPQIIVYCGYQSQSAGFWGYFQYARYVYAFLGGEFYRCNLHNYNQVHIFVTFTITWKSQLWSLGKASGRELSKMRKTKQNKTEWPH